MPQNYYNKHYEETITNLNDNLNYLKFAQTTGAIEFNDYFEKSKEAIKETKLEEESLKKDNKEFIKANNFTANGCILAGILGIILTPLIANGGLKNLKKELKECGKVLLLGLIPIAFGLGARGVVNINKEEKEQKYIQEAQKSLQVYKAEKLKSLEAYKNEILKQSTIETTVNK